MQTSSVCVIVVFVLFVVCLAFFHNFFTFIVLPTFHGVFKVGGNISPFDIRQLEQLLVHVGKFVSESDLVSCLDIPII